MSAVRRVALPTVAGAFCGECQWHRDTQPGPPNAVASLREEAADHAMENGHRAVVGVTTSVAFDGTPTQPAPADKESS